MKSFRKNSIDLNNLSVEESLFALGNGYLGVRGNYEEGYPPELEEIRGTYINGVYARIPIDYAEGAYGFPTVGDKQPRLFDAQSIEIFLDGEKVLLNDDNYTNYQRELSFDDGTSTRCFTYQTKEQKPADISFTRLVSFTTKELFAISLSINYQGDIVVKSTLDTAIENYTNKNDPRVAGAHSKLLTTTKAFTEPFLYAEATILESGLCVACGVTHTVKQGDLQAGQQEGTLLSNTILGNGAVSFTKFAVYSDSLRQKNLKEGVQAILAKAVEEGIDALLKKQQNHLASFWEHSDIIIDDDELQMAVRFAVFQLYQSVGKDEFSNISAKGLSGEGYEGHYFWDTEIYIFPYYLVTNPKIAKNLLEFRYKTLPLAKEEAKKLGAHRGAKFPWRTISGIESSAYFPAGQAQYHINGDIAYSIIQYYFAVKDDDFIANCGIEILLEISLFFLEVGHFRNGAFCIDKVTGPDEYTALVNNNYYTNMLAQHCFKWTTILLERYLDESQLSSLLEKTSATPNDLLLIKQAEEQMLLPYDNALGIALQDENFTNLSPWNKQDDKRPLLLHYHPLKIYSAQILKQADAVLAHFLKEDIATEEAIKNTYHYYEKITTHDSSLSVCLYGMMACRIGELEKAKNYFLDSVYLDIKNTHHNTKDGLHMASLAGSAMYVIYGFGGLRIKEDSVVLRPVKPQGFPNYSFIVQAKGSSLQVEVSDQICITRLSGTLMELSVFDTRYSFNEENQILLPLP